METKQPAAGHRQRLKQQYISGGLDSFSDEKAMELLLTFAIPRKDTKELAKRLLDYFGGFANVLDAPMDKLLKISGMTPNAALLVCLQRDCARRQLIERSTQETVLKSLDECAKYLVPFFQSRRDEAVYLLSMDAKGKVINCQCIGEGSVNSANAPIRKIVAAALDMNATAVVLAHNHPSGVALPSKEDVHATGNVLDALKAVGVQMLDHVIVADGDYISMRQSKYLPAW